MTKTIRVPNIACSFVDAGDTIRFNYHDKPRYGTIEAIESSWFVLRDATDNFKSYSYGKVHDCEYVCN